MVDVTGVIYISLTMEMWLLGVGVHCDVYYIGYECKNILCCMTSKRCSKFVVYDSKYTCTECIVV